MSQLTTKSSGFLQGRVPGTPLDINNRMGLPAVSYRMGEYAHFRASLVAGLSSAAHPALAGLRTRDTDDYTLALLDAFACTADVLTFYQERIANESWLRTATERVSLQEMAKLIGYQLRPGLAAETWLSFALESPRQPPVPQQANAPAQEPGAFVTGIPAVVHLAQGLKLQSLPGPGEAPQIFETVEAISARPEWNAVRPWLSATSKPAFGDRDAWLQGVRTSLKPGDALLFVGPEFEAQPTSDNHWDFRLLSAVEPDPANDRTHVRWGRPLGSLAPRSSPSASPRVFALRKRAAVFGHNAPMWAAMNDSFQRGYSAAQGDALGNNWPAFTISPSGFAASSSGGFVDLDGLQPDATPGGYAVLAKGAFNSPGEGASAETYVELYQVRSAAEVSRAEFALSAKVTRLALRGQNLGTKFYNHVRETSVFVQSEELALAPRPVHTVVQGDQLPLALLAVGALPGDQAGAPACVLLPGRRLVVNGDAVSTGAPCSHQAQIVSVLAGASSTVLTISPPLPAALRRASVVVHLNVALASHGESVAQILGAGDASQVFQRFEIKRQPLTYRSAANSLGANSELTIRVGDVAWTQRNSLFGAALGERAYTVASDVQGQLWVQFGDGVRGARLPSGVNNIRASYRQGIGQAGNVAAGQITQLLSRPLGLKSVANPLPALGGTDAEPAEWARRSMPLGTRTLGRAVSLLDYEDFALGFTGIAKAQARVLQLAAGSTIAITVAGQGGAAVPTASPVWANLLAALKAGGDPHVSVSLLGFEATTFRLGLKVKRHVDYELGPLLVAVESALRAHFSFEARGLAQPVFASEVVAVAHGVPGVVAVDLDFLYGGSAPASQTTRSLQPRLLAQHMRVSTGASLVRALPAQLLTLDPAPFDRLEELT